MYYSNGQLKSIENYKYGRQDGESKHYYKDGVLSIKQLIKTEN